MNTLVRTAARNAWAVTFGDGIEPRHATPSVVLYDDEHQLLRRFGSANGGDGAPVLLVPPLAAPATCFDLRPGQSVAEFLLHSGRTPYLVDYGTIGFSDRALGMEHWIDEIIPNAVRRASRDSGGRTVDIVTWSLGGTLSLLTSAAHTDLPIRSITAIGTPIDYAQLPMMRPLRAVGKVTGGQVISTANRVVGGFPSTLTRAGFKLTALDRELTKPLFIARNLLNTEALGRMQAVDRFMSAMPAYPGRFYGQIYTRLMMRNDLAKGGLRLGSRRIEFAKVGVPVLLVAGTGDVICTVDAARAATDVLTGSPFVRFETAPGSHLGVLAGPTARGTTWSYIDEFLTEQASLPFVD